MVVKPLKDNKDKIKISQIYLLKKIFSAFSESLIFGQGGLNKKEIQLNICNIFSIFIFNELYLLD